MDVVYQGSVATDGSTKITCTTNGTLYIVSMIINNSSSNYVFNLNRFDINPTSGATISQVSLCEMNLDMGDTLRDDGPYILFQGDYLQLISDVAGTSYYIKATQF